ncbi:uncharacterized protein [Temnothorax longispinosus]|uniref:uncharacterized protein isoform X2 n=1 Tax=Temnothorax longispinosus TaxID=300112 RepID=UPI003A9A2C8C
MFAYVKFGDGAKTIVSTSEIKNFNPETSNRTTKKYKVRWKEDNEFYDAVIIDVGDSKKALEERIANRRPRIPLFEKCQSASESELESSINNNTINEKLNINEKIQERLKQKNLDVTNKHLGGPANAINKRNMTGSTKETVSKKSKSVKITDHTKRDSQDNVKKSSNGENSIESLKLQIHDLKLQNNRLKENVKENEKYLQEVRELNSNLQTKIIDDFEELKAIITDLCKKNAGKEQRNPGELPVGYRSMEKNLVYLGHDVWITNCQYDSIINISKTCSIFVKNLAIAVFGTPTLKASSVTGTISNRIKNKRNEKPRPKLDPAKMLAIKDTFRHWLSTERGYDEVAIDFEVQQVGTYISQKISELNREKKARQDVTKGIVNNSHAEAGKAADFCNVVIDEQVFNEGNKEIQDVHNNDEQNQPENGEDVNEEKESFDGDKSENSVTSKIHSETDDDKTEDTSKNSLEESNTP